MTIRHIVLFRFRPGTDAASVAALGDALDDLPSRIDEIRTYRHGADLAVTDGTWDYALVADFASVEDYRSYATHPAHLAVIEARVTPIAEHIARVQHQL